MYIHTNQLRLVITLLNIDLLKMMSFFADYGIYRVEIVAIFINKMLKSGRKLFYFFLFFCQSTQVRK